jgi:hypothetical protein|tara:strand:- start:405 stop:653 length:249 start_codon:yes stop_codon:yes gene_type:complete
VIASLNIPPEFIVTIDGSLFSVHATNIVAISDVSAALDASYRVAITMVFSGLILVGMTELCPDLLVSVTERLCLDVRSHAAA